jgi:hypothetical protein
VSADAVSGWAAGAASLFSVFAARAGRYGATGASSFTPRVMVMWLVRLRMR